MQDDYVAGVAEYDDDPGYSIEEELLLDTQYDIGERHAEIVVPQSFQDDRSLSGMLDKAKAKSSSATSSAGNVSSSAWDSSKSSASYAADSVGNAAGITGDVISDTASRRAYLRSRAAARDAARGTRRRSRQTGRHVASASSFNRLNRKGAMMISSLPFLVWQHPALEDADRCADHKERGRPALLRKPSMFDRTMCDRTTNARRSWRYAWWGVATIIAILFATAALPLLPVDLWWIRIGDYPRLRLMIAYLVCLPLLLLCGINDRWASDSAVLKDEFTFQMVHPPPTGRLQSQGRPRRRTLRCFVRSW